MAKSSLFVILFILASFFAVSAQTSALKNDLGNSFKDVSVVRLNAGDALRQAQASRTLSIATSTKTFELSLTPRDLRAARYFAEDTTAVGVRRLEKTPVTTYKGKIVGEAKSEVRLTIDNSGVEGYFLEGAERYFIEPAKRYSEFASADEFIVYKAEDALRETGFSCPQDLAEKLEDGKKMVLTSGNVQSLNGLKAIEIATEADFDFVQTTGNSASAANANILSILNMVEGVYETDVNLTVSVVYQHTWSTADPYNGTNTGTLLNSFQTYWNTNYPTTQYPRDTAHLFTDKPNVRSQGFAYLGVICNNPAFAYGMSGRINVAGLEAANFLVTAHEIGHNLGATHSDSYSNCVDSLMNIQISQYTQPTFCSASRSEVSNFVSANGVCLTGRNFGRLDFDGDGKTDIGIFRPSSGEWWINRSATSQTTAARFGVSSDKVASGDFTGDGKTDIAFWRPSNGYWFILRSEDNSFFSFPFGAAGDVPAPADYDGDGKTDAAVFRPASNTWFILQSGGGTGILTFGTAGDVPVPADYDGDGKSDIAIFRPSDGSWWYLRSSDNQYRVFRFGVSTDKPVQGDYTGDGKADVAIFRPSTGYWFILRSEDSSFYSVPFGAAGDVPSPGDYDGDGKFDTAVFRPASNTWFINRTTAGTAIVTFGSTGDSPIPNAFVP